MVFEFLKKANVVVSSVNVKWRGSTHSLGGISVRSDTFDIIIPFQNKPQEDFNLDFLKTQKRPPITITKIDVKEPFKLVSAEPALPKSVEENEKALFKLRIKPPDYGYEGPLGVELVTDNSDMVHVEISKIIISTKEKRTEIADKPLIMDLAKGQIFKQNIHLFGIIDFEAQINKIEAAAPFKLVSSDPKTPFRIDRKTGYLIDVFVQAPDSDYGGPMELILS